MFCVVIVKKCSICLAQVVFSYFVLHSSKITLVLTTNVLHLRSLQDRVVRRVYLAIISKLSQKRVIQFVDYGC